MKKLIAMVLCLVLALSLAGCKKQSGNQNIEDKIKYGISTPENTKNSESISGEGMPLTEQQIPEDISSIKLNAYGKTVQINDADEIAEIKSVIESIAFEPADSDASVEAPGAISVTVTLECQDGSQQEITYPYYLYDGNTYAADETSIASFNKFFD